MPKFTYSASKGIEQSSGSGFFVEDVAISPAVSTVTTANDVSSYVDSGAENVVVVTLALTNDILRLNDGASTGETKTIVMAVTGNAADLKVMDSGGSHPATGALTITENATVSVVKQLIWNGSTWNLLS